MQDPKMLAQLLQRLGAEHSPDSQLAYLTKAEMQRLHQQGGSGRIDPITGIPHFDEDSGDSGSSGDGDSGGSMGSGSANNVPTTGAPLGNNVSGPAPVPSSGGSSGSGSTLGKVLGTIIGAATGLPGGAALGGAIGGWAGGKLSEDSPQDFDAGTYYKEQNTNNGGGAGTGGSSSSGGFGPPSTTTGTYPSSPVGSGGFGGPGGSTSATVAVPAKAPSFFKGQAATPYRQALNTPAAVPQQEVSPQGQLLFEALKLAQGGIPTGRTRRYLGDV